MPIGVIGVERKIHFFAFDLPHSDAVVAGYPAETTEAFCDGHVRAFAFFGRVQGDLFGVGGRGMHESIRPVAGAIVPLALMGVRCFPPHNTVGLSGLEAAVLADEPSVFTSHPVAAFSLAQMRNDHAAT
jgi:hypothetical protein